MQPEKPDRDDGSPGQGKIRLLRRGIIVYLIAAALIAAACYLFGWGAMEWVGTSYLNGAVFLLILGLCMVAGNLIPLQLSNTKDVTSQTALG